MLRSVLSATTAVLMMSATPAMADDKSDSQKGLAMIKAELKKNHPKPVLEALRKALSDVELEEAEQDWSECVTYVKTARAVLRK